MKVHIFYILITCIIPYKSYLQTVFFQDICECGITGAGFSTGLGSGNGSMVIYTEPGSVVRKAYLFAQRFGNAQSVGVNLNGINYFFNSQNQVSNNFTLPNTPVISAVHAIDITNDINLLQSNYSISIPTQLDNPFGVSYGNIYLYVVYEKTGLQEVNTNILLNNQDMNQEITSYISNDLNPLNSNYPIGFALYTDRLNSPFSTNDGSFLFINNINIGLTGGSMGNDASWNSGSRGHFYYQNNTLFGLDDDIANTTVDENDGLADISSNINNNSTSLNWKLIWQTPNTYYNIYSGFFLTYTTPCQEFPTTLNTTDTSLCRGDTVQLHVSGGNTALTKPAYEWLPQRGLSCYDCPNPLASPDSSTTYTVRIWNTDSCSKVLPVRVRVKDVPDYSFTTHNFICGEQKGALTFSVNGNDTYTYQVGTEVQSSPTFNFLTTGNTFIKVTGANGCSAGEIANLQGENDVVAHFTAEPPEGEAPLNVWFNNQSENAHFYDWFINTDTLLDENPSMRFDTIGVYPITLVACKKENECCDTANYNLIVHPEVSAFVPNIITPNGDGVNDQFRAELRGATDAQMQIRNRWGNPMGQDNATGTITNNGYYLELFWNGYTKGKRVPNGVYFYAITYTDWRGEEQNVTGSFQVVVE